MIEKFDTKKIAKQLRKINRENNKPVNAGIQLIINNMEAYNNIVNNIDYSNNKNLYLVYQLSSTIFNQLDKFGIFPDKKKDKDNDDNDKLSILKQKIEKR